MRKDNVIILKKPGALLQIFGIFFGSDSGMVVFFEYHKNGSILVDFNFCFFH